MMKVPYVNLAAQHGPIREKLLAAVGNVIDHSQFILGPEVTEFERRFADECGARFAVGVNSGTDALILALKALGVGPGDEVITVSSSFVASGACIALVGARAVFVDVGEDYNIDPACIEPAITSRTRAILPVHLTGRPADMDPIMDIAKKYGLHVIEDSAQAVWAEYKGKKTGALGTVGCFSFHPLKTLNACGDGGALTTDEPDLYESFKSLRNHGLRNRDECDVWAFNSRLDTLQAAILLVKMEYSRGWIEQRRLNARMYQRLLADVSQVQVPVDKPYEWAVYHTFVIQAERRDALRAHLSAKGVGSAIHYPIPIHLQKAADGLNHKGGSLQVTERHAGRILSLPIYQELEARQVEYVAECIRCFYDSVE